MVRNLLSFSKFYPRTGVLCILYPCSHQALESQYSCLRVIFSSFYFSHMIFTAPLSLFPSRKSVSTLQCYRISSREFNFDHKNLEHFRMKISLMVLLISCKNQTHFGGKLHGYILVKIWIIWVDFATCNEVTILRTENDDVRNLMFPDLLLLPGVPCQSSPISYYLNKSSGRDE